MAVADDPKKYIGMMVTLPRQGRNVKVHLCNIGGGKYFRGAWIDIDGKPWAGMVPFAELDKALQKQPNDKKE